MYDSPQDEEFNTYERSLLVARKLKRQLFLYRVTTVLFGLGLFIMAILKVTESTIVCE